MLTNKDCPYVDQKCDTHAQCRDCESKAKNVIHNTVIWKNHTWEKEESGEIDFWAFEYGFCNGPRCARCGATFCRNCVRDVDVELNREWDCVVEENRCPWCDHRLDGMEDDWAHCPWCGQKINAKELQYNEFRYEE